MVFGGGEAMGPPPWPGHITAMYTLYTHNLHMHYIYTLLTINLHIHYIFHIYYLEYSIGDGSSTLARTPDLSPLRRPMTWPNIIPHHIMQYYTIYYYIVQYNVTLYDLIKFS